MLHPPVRDEDGAGHPLRWSILGEVVLGCVGGTHDQVAAGEPLPFRHQTSTQVRR